MTSIGGIEDASREMWRRSVRGHRRRRERERICRLLRLTDVMVDDLERLNLEGVETVGREWRPRLESLFAAMPFVRAPRLRARPSPTEVLDLVFDLQAPLLELKQSWSRERVAPWWLSRGRRQR